MLPRGLLKQHSSTLSLIARLVDVFCVVCGAYIAYILRAPETSTSTHYSIAFVLSGLLTFIVFSTLGIYESLRGKSWFSQGKQEY